MSDVEIRPAGAADLVALVAAFGDEGHFTDRLARQRERRGVLLTAWILNEPVGHLYVWLEPADEQELRDHLPGVPLLNRVEVRPDLRRRLIGTELMFHAEKVLAEHGHDRVALAVRTDNEHAARLYRRLGYEFWPHDVIKCVSWVDGSDGRLIDVPEICQVMVKTLPGSHASGRAPQAPSPRRASAE